MEVETSFQGHLHSGGNGNCEQHIYRRRTMLKVSRQAHETRTANDHPGTRT